MTNLLLVLLFLAIFLEGVVTTMPLVLILLFLLYVLKKELWIFPVAFLSGLILDLFLLNTLGLSSIFFVIFLFVVLLYERKFEIESPIFVFIASFLGSFAYAFVFGNGFAFQSAMVSAFLSTCFFLFVSRMKRKEVM